MFIILLYNITLCIQIRCHSWSSSGRASTITTTTKNTFAPQTRISLGFSVPKYHTTASIIGSPPLLINNKAKSKQRLCSCSSQTDLYSPPDSVDNSSSTPSLQNSFQAGR